MRRDLSAWMQSLSSVARRPTQMRGRRPRSVTLAGQSLGGGESLERRSMLAVTASLSFGRLFIDLNAGGDEATLTSDGTNYTVAGTGYSATTFALSGVNRIYARGNWSETNTTFTVGKGSDIVNDILVNGAVGTTVIDQAIAPTKGQIEISSPIAISLNANLTTVDAGISLAGPVTLGGTSSDTITVGAGGSGVTFLSTVDGASRLVVNYTAATVFGGAIGGKTALASLETDAGGETVISAATVTTVGAAGQVYGDAVRIQANATFDAGTGPVMFAAMAGLETALWDIAGKIAGQPVVNLVGGMIRDKIRVYANGWYKDMHDFPKLRERVKHVVGMGYTAMKFDPFGAGGTDAAGGGHAHAIGRGREADLFRLRAEARRDVGEQGRQHQRLDADGGDRQRQQKERRALLQAHSGERAGCCSNTATGICS